MYKIKHKRTGLFWINSRIVKSGDHYVKSNLSKKGKIYENLTENQKNSWVLHYRNERGENMYEGKKDFEIIKL